jgi:hypothetical protein
MRATPGDIKFEAMGIAKALVTKLLRVLVYQREYSWDAEEVNDLFRDLSAAVSRETYFLGAIVLKKKNGNHFEVIDGQQRLATVSILLEQKEKQDPEPEWTVNDDPTQLTLEHVLPERPSDQWRIGPEKAAGLYRRLGNMVLLRLSVNSRIGNSSFEEKKKAYKGSSHLKTTKQVLGFKQWGEAEIDQRQRKLAEIAVETWPFSLG